MRFITEEDLRLQYRKEPFDEYEPQPGTRLTPGARQFLNDRGIRIPLENGAKNRITMGTEPCAAIQVLPKNNETSELSASVQPIWQLKLKTLQAEFLQTGVDLMQSDVLTAGAVFDLERYLARIGQNKNDWDDWKTLCPQCESIGPENSGSLMDDCFEITGFHAQSPEGKSLVKLHMLRCSLRELEPQLPDEKKEMAHYIINRLSQMICHLFGGKLCQKK